MSNEKKCLACGNTIKNEEPFFTIQHPRFDLRRVITGYTLRGYVHKGCTIFKEEGEGNE